MRFEIELDAEEPLSLPPEVVACIRGGDMGSDPRAQTRVRGEFFRDHSAFLAGYAPEDEGLYDDV